MKHNPIIHAQWRANLLQNTLVCIMLSQEIQSIPSNHLGTGPGQFTGVGSPAFPCNLSPARKGSAYAKLQEPVY